jgi:Uma2 family endonuclease
MNIPTLPTPPEVVVYPEDDGLPMSDNTLQYEYMHTIKGGLDALFADKPDVFVAGNLLWYPVEGDNTTRQAADVMVVFGRQKGHRGSYRQWEEGGIAPQVVFEILSPGNRLSEMMRKFRFYERYGVEEYYVYSPHDGDLIGYQRQGDDLVEIAVMDDWPSPRLGVRFQRVGNELELYRPDGRKLPSYVELEKQWASERAEKERERAEKERAQREAEQAKQQAEQLRAKLKALGIDPDA